MSESVLHTDVEVEFYKGTEAGTAVQTRTNTHFFGTVDALVPHLTIIFARLML